MITVNPTGKSPAADSLCTALGWPETVGMVVLLVLILSARFLPTLRANLPPNTSPFRHLRDELELWIAQGFGLGRIPFAPGTFGTGGGILWVLLLAAGGELWIYLAGLGLGLAAAVWLCGRAEKLLEQTDPASVVLDEIAALPIAFLPWIISHGRQFGATLSPEIFFDHPQWVLTLAIFVLFRVFDILKPWPVRQSQALPGGWGVTADDCLAALYAALLTLPAVC